MRRLYDLAVTAWTCPQCDRRFGRRNQSHTCVPATSVDDYFAGRPPVQRAICDAVTAHLESLGPVVIDAVQVGILYKRKSTFAEVRAKKTAVGLSILLSRQVVSERFARSVRVSASRNAYFINLTEPGDVDDDVRGWLTEGYLDSRE